MTTEGAFRCAHAPYRDSALLGKPAVTPGAHAQSRGVTRCVRQDDSVTCMTTVFIPEGAKGAQIVFKAKYGFSSLYPTCEMSVLTEFEATLPGGTLPTSYRDFLLQWNGGRFSSQVNVGFPLRDSDDVSDCGRVFHFYGLFNFTHNFDLRQASQRYGFRKAVPTEYIAIGDDYHWDQLCISVYGNDVGFIYWWQPGEPWPEETEPTTQSLRPVAESFEKFWDLLFEIDEAE